MLQNTKTWKSRNCAIVIIKIVLLKHNLLTKYYYHFIYKKILIFEVFEVILIWNSHRACVLQTCAIVDHNFNMPIA